MATTSVELARRAHEELERVERFAATALEATPRTHRERWRQNYLAGAALERGVERAKRLVRRARCRASNHARR